MSAHGDRHAAIDFVTILFGPSTCEAVYCCSLPNDKGSEQASERSIAGRDPEQLLAFLNRWDRADRGAFFCVSTINAGKRRNKANAVEMPALHLDLDFKDIIISPEEALLALQGLRKRPSIINQSGHGLHAYWVFKEAIAVQDNLDRIEAALRQLADMLGGDLKVCQVAALMRVPGTHNTKGGQWWEVETIELNELRYELDDLEEWFAEQSPVIARKVKPLLPETNPYVAIAEKFGFKPPIDVETRLSAMTYQGTGDSAIHDTQRAVSASLISRGASDEDVVSLLLDATRVAAGGYGERWNWRREESNLRRMCQTWRGKIETERESGVVHIAEARAAQANAKTKSLAAAPERKGKKHHALAQATLVEIRDRGEDVLFENNMVWHYIDGLWSLRPDYRQWLQMQIERTCRHLGIASDNRLINETRSWLERNPDLTPNVVAWDTHGMVPMKSGLVDPRSLQHITTKPEHHATWRVNCSHTPQAGCPLWEQMLTDAFADRDVETRTAVVSALQEVLGAALIDRKPRGLRKALVFLGGNDCGKSELLCVFGGLFSEESISTPLAAIDTTHGLVQFQRRLPWVLNEAFNQNIWHMSATVKSLITHDPILINYKHGPVVTKRFSGPIFWGTNHPPQFKESTRAIIERLIVIECRQRFTADEPVGVGVLAAAEGFSGPGDFVLARERAGILNWALAGLQRALARGFIQLPEEAKAMAAQIYRDSNLVAGFIEECVDYDADARLTVPDFCVAVAAWFVENKGENRSLPSNDTIGRAVVALHDDRIVSDTRELRDKATRYLIGVRLNSHGLEYHERGTSADLFEGKTVQTTGAGSNPNKTIPIAWDVKPLVRAMRAAHAREAAKAKKEVSSDDTSTSVTKKSVIEKCHPSQAIDPSDEPRF